MTTITPNTAASGAADALRAAITRAFHLGQTYWQQADSESYAEQDKSDDTYKKYKALLETCTTLSASAPVAPAPLQQGEYLPLPQPDTHCYDDDKQVDVWSHSAEQMRAYGEANWKAGYKQGALADAAPDNRVLAAQPAPVAEDADPLQGAANWLVTSQTITSATTLGGRLCIGYNRAERLFNAARAQAAQPEGGA